MAGDYKGEHREKAQYTPNVGHLTMQVDLLKRIQWKRLSLQNREMNMKKIIIPTLLIIFLVPFVFRGLHGKSGYKEGVDINLVTARFPKLPDGTKCFYSIDIISAGGIGPTRYKITVMYLIDNVSMEKLKKNYNWEETKLIIDNKCYEQVGVSNSINWYFNNDFKEEILGGRFIGEVYFAIDGKCIYIEAEE